MFNARGVGSGPRKGSDRRTRFRCLLERSLPGNVSHFEGNEGDQYKSYKASNDRSYALPKCHGGDRGRGKIK